MSEGLGACVINEYDVAALGELCGQLLLVAGAMLFFQYADKDDNKPHVQAMMNAYESLISLIPERASRSLGIKETPADREEEADGQL